MIEKNKLYQIKEALGKSDSPLGKLELVTKSGSFMLPKYVIVRNFPKMQLWGLDICLPLWYTVGEVLFEDGVTIFVTSNEQDANEIDDLVGPGFKIVLGV